MRSRVPLFVFLLTIVSFALPHLAYAKIPFFGPIVPTDIATCAGSWGALISVINNIISLLITLVITAVAPLTIGYAGFLYVINPVNPEGRHHANTILLNGVVGIVIALSAYLIVTAIMAVLYNPGAQGLGTQWSNILVGNSNDLCLNIKGTLAQVTPGSGSYPTPNPNQPLGSGTGACDPNQVQQGAAAGGYQISNQESNILACIAKPESSCGAVNQNYNWGKGSSAYGAFQVTLSGNSNCYDNPACEQAAGVTGPLNCSTGFSHGNPIPGNPVVAKCQMAASNLNCSASAAACLVAQNGGSYSAWTADPSSSAQQQCITQGGG